MLADTLETYAAPRQLGRYELIAPLGEGGMARVYVAVQRGPIANKLVVVKLLREQFTGDEHFVAMFADESRIAVLLNHPNVIHTYESSSSDSEYYIVMEFLEGKTLAQAIRRVGRANFPLQVHLWVLCEILAGLHYAHELSDFGGEPLNIVHRDVSPTNILITVRGEVKLLDFGIAKVQGSIAETQHGIIKGKLGYASPEQCLGMKADGRADLYSVGVMLWEALAGKRRPVSETALATTRPGVQAAETDIAETLHGVPMALARIVRRALSRDPADRYQTARAFELELRQYLVDSAASNGAPALQALISGHFGGELAAIRRAIDEQVGSIRQSVAPEPRSARPSQLPAFLGSEAPHNIGVTAPPKPPSSRLRQLSMALLFGMTGVLSAFVFSRVSPSAKPVSAGNTALGAALSTQPGPSTQAQTLPPAADSSRDALLVGTGVGARELPAESSAGASKRRPVRVERGEPPSAALKPRTAPSLPARAPVRDAGSLSSPSSAKFSAPAEPGIDLKQTTSTSTVRSLDERDPYAP